MINEIKLFGIPIFKASSVTWTVDQVYRWLLQQGKGEKINESNAFKKHVWVYSAINSIAQNVPRAPFKIYNRPKNKEEDLVEVTNSPVNLIFNKPSKYFNKFQLFEGIEVYKNMRGEAFILIERLDNTVTGFEFLPPDNMKALENNGTLVAWELRLPNGGTIVYDLEDIIHIKYFNPYSKFRGLSPLSAAMLSVLTDDEARRWNRNVIANGSSVGGVLEYDGKLNDAQFERVKRDWQRNNSGIDNAGKIAILEGGAKYTELRLTQTDVSYIEQRVQSKQEIGAIFKVPPNELNDYENANYNSQTQSLNFWNKKLFPEMTSIEASFNESFFQVYFPEYIGLFDRKVIPEIQATLESKIKQGKELFSMGVPLDQINKKLDLGLDLNDYPSASVAYLAMNLIDANVEPIVEEEPEPEPIEEPIDEDEKKIFNLQKAINKLDAETKKKFYKWKAFINKVNPLVGRFTPVLRKYIFQLRQEILKNFYDQADDLLEKSVTKATPLFDVNKQKRRIVELSEPYYEDAVKQGGSLALNEIGIEVEFSLTGNRTVDFYNKTREEISTITDTINKQVQAAIEKGIKEGESVTTVSDSIKRVLTSAQNRAKTIARTEMSKAVNGSKFSTLEDNGIEKIQWVNSFDDKVRENPNHKISEIIKIGNEFSNGLKYPQDPDGSGSTPENIINCRCTTAAEV
jgi:HK97 family phage portal protein